MKELKVHVFWNSTVKFWQADTDDGRYARGKTRGEAIKILGKYVEKTDAENEREEQRARRSAIEDVLYYSL